MAKKNVFAERRKMEQEADAWFDRTNDNIPFKAFADEQEEISTGEEMLGEIRRKINKQKLYKLWRNMAAAAVILISVGTFAYRSYQSANSTTITQTWDSYVAKKGEFKKILLPDSSVVHLRPGAKIQVAHPFKQQTRQVKLETGEVYFEVSHDPAHPFLVTTGQLTTEVLGTKFIINNDPLLTDIRVDLLSGKVAVRNQKTQLGILLPHQQLSFNRYQETAKLEDHKAYSTDSWLKGEYFLEDVPLKSFAETFGNTFSMEVKFKQKALERLHVSMQFNKGDDPKNILNQLKLIHRLHYQIKDKEVMLMK